MTITMVALSRERIEVGLVQPDDVIVMGKAFTSPEVCLTVRLVTRDARPHATTVSRALAGCDLATFSNAFLTWLQRAALDDQPAERRSRRRSLSSEVRRSRRP